MSSRKAELFSHKLWYYGFAIPFLIIFMLLILGFFTTALGNTAVAVPKELESFLFQQRFINSPQCFSASRPYANTFVNQVDVNKFTQKVLDSCYAASKDSKGKAFTLRLKDKGGKEMTVLTTKNWGYATRVTRRTAEVTLIDSGKTGKGSFVMEFYDVK